MAKITLENRFYAKTKRDENGCLIWTGGKRDLRGYGSFSIGGRNFRAHRVSYAMTYGYIPKGHIVRHYVCDNPACVEPKHLRLGSQKDNVHDMIRKGRAKHQKEKVNA